MADEVMKCEHDCFAHKNSKCKVLRVKQCEGVGCSFYKTEHQLQMERQKAFEHIQALDVSIRNVIRAMYKLDIEKQFSGVSGYGS